MQIYSLNQVDAAWSCSQERVKKDKAKHLMACIAEAHSVKQCMCCQEQAHQQINAWSYQHGRCLILSISEGEGLSRGSN